MGEVVRVWTKQHENILNDINSNGRYIVKKEYIVLKMEEHAALYLDVYDWFHHAACNVLPPPQDVKYPVWVSLTREGKIENSPGNVELELLVPKEQLLTFDMDKWGNIVNYMYIPANAEDEKAHEAMLAQYGIDDCTAYIKPFYPNIKRKIIKSWERLFDESVTLSKVRTGTIWEIKKEWIVSIST